MKLLSVILIIGFLVVDFLFFHDIFKLGETTSAAQWITGVLSVIAIILAMKILATKKLLQR